MCYSLEEELVPAGADTRELGEGWVWAHHTVSALVGACVVGAHVVPERGLNLGLNFVGVLALADEPWDVGVGGYEGVGGKRDLVHELVAEGSVITVPAALDVGLLVGTHLV